MNQERQNLQYDKLYERRRNSGQEKCVACYTDSESRRVNGMKEWNRKRQADAACTKSIQ